MQVLPADIRNKLLKHGRRAELLEVVLDLGRRPEARFLDLGNGQGGGEYLRDEEVRQLCLSPLAFQLLLKASVSRGAAGSASDGFLC